MSDHCAAGGGSTTVASDELRLALDAGMVPRELWWAPDVVADDRRRLVDEVAATGATIVPVSRAVFEKVAYREGADGLVGVVGSVGRPVHELPVGKRDLVLLAQGVEKPGNLGAMLRTADAAGCDAVVAADPDLRVDAVGGAPVARDQAHDPARVLAGRVVGDLQRRLGSRLVGDHDEREHAPQGHRADVVAQLHELLGDGPDAGGGQVDDHGILQVRPSRASMSCAHCGHQ